MISSATAGAHLRLFVVIGDTLRGRDDDPLLAGKDGVGFAVHEKADVGRFFRFGDLRQPQAGAGDDLGQRIPDLFFLGKATRTLRLGSYSIMVTKWRPRSATTGKWEKAGFGQAPRDLDFPLAPDVIENDGIAAADPPVGRARPVDFDDGLERFVLLAAAIGRPDGWPRTDADS